MDKVDKQYTETVSLMSKNLEKLSDSICEGFAFLRMMYMTPPPSIYANGQLASSPSLPPYNPMYPSSRAGTSSSSWNMNQ